MVIITNDATTDSFTTTTTALDTMYLGVVEDASIADTVVGNILIFGIRDVNKLTAGAGAAFLAGELAATSTTAKLCRQSNNPGSGGAMGKCLRDAAAGDATVRMFVGLPG